MHTREEIAAFVASLAIPEDRREIVLAELLDQLACSTRDGADPGFGDLAQLRARLEAIEPAFQFGFRAGLARAAATSAALLAASALVRVLSFSLPLGASPISEMLSESAPLVFRGALLTGLLFLITPSVVWTQLAAAHRAGAFRRSW